MGAGRSWRDHALQDALRRDVALAEMGAHYRLNLIFNLRLDGVVGGEAVPCWLLLSDTGKLEGNPVGIVKSQDVDFRDSLAVTINTFCDYAAKDDALRGQRHFFVPAKLKKGPLSTHLCPRPLRSPKKVNSSVRVQRPGDQVALPR